MNTGYIIGTLFFLTGSFMLFMHRLVAEAVRYLGHFVNDTIHMNYGLYVPSFGFMLVGLIFILLEYVYKRLKEKM
ncbi:hypothetical protein [Lysinibacillus sp. NPDC093688]|uniref:hypothetical protein n=1 Tax=Lysinibacillus sp. NPDC093688 TaxID=3390577 RepID=UPI003CFD16A4